jgi:hypothetical protein
VSVFRYRRYIWQHRTKLWAWNMRRRSANEGFINGRSLWQLLAVVLYGRRLIRNVLRSKPEVVATERLGPGHVLTIRTIDPRSEPGG